MIVCGCVEVVCEKLNVVMGEVCNDWFVVFGDLEIVLLVELLFVLIV